MTELAEHSTPPPPPLQAPKKDADAVFDNAERSLPRRRFVDDMPDKGLFLIVAVVGFAAIVFLKRLGGDGLGANWPIWARSSDTIAAGAVALMLIYGLIALQMPMVRLRPDRLGDNFYYLGFIFTLASLSAALFQFREGIQINDILGGFGIALVTTIVGIIGRVVFLQMRSEIDDVEEAVRRDLATTAATLRAQLGETIREFETFRTTLLQTMHEAEIHFTKGSKAQIEAADAVTQHAARILKQSIDGNADHASALNGSIQSIAQHVKDAGQRAKNLSIPSDKLNGQLTEFGKGLEAELKRLSAIIDDVAQRSRPKRRFWLFGRRR